MKSAMFAILVLALTFITYGTNISNLPLSLALTLVPDAAKTLESHDIWHPSAKSFAAGPPDMVDNLNTTNCTVEAQKFVESGLDINDLVRVTIHATTDTSEDDTEAVVVVKSASDGVDKDCGRCGTCQKVCFGTFWFLPLYAMVSKHWEANMHSHGIPLTSTVEGMNTKIIEEQKRQEDAP
ncbi:hypothetical protein VP1G_02039 [Cytospora mali]|uniref:4Fe-4S ferredoxin-type domain-containing protein n=1 Tax=Cytospora mali TaxID=578113 RepID=A0A194USS8_CYTMA|nr:hypothetical protein VP1G_02039 [Valsa mali var. pyri (nom. inval.)]